MSLPPDVVICVVVDNPDDLFITTMPIREKFAPGACHEFASGHLLLAWLAAQARQRVI